jgi:hypothetical protein
MNRREDGTIDFGADPEIAGELERGRNRQARQRLPVEKRTRAARQAEVDARRNRRNIDIPLELEDELESMAADLSVPFSQLLCRLAWEGKNRVGVVELQEERVPSRSMRFWYTLPIPGLNLQKRNRKNAG